MSAITYAYSLSDADALEALRAKLTTPDPEPIYSEVFDQHMDALDPNFDRLEQDALYAMRNRTRPTT